MIRQKIINYDEIIKCLASMTLEQLSNLIREASQLQSAKMRKDHNPLLDIIGVAENCPEDGAENHDKYLYGKL